MRSLLGYSLAMTSWDTYHFMPTWIMRLGHIRLTQEMVRSILYCIYTFYDYNDYILFITKMMIFRLWRNDGLWLMTLLRMNYGLSMIKDLRISMI